MADSRVRRSAPVSGWTGVVACLLVVHCWIVGAGLVGDRTASLPRRLSRFCLLVGSAIPIGTVLVAASQLAPEPARWIVLVPGVVIGAAGWLALPAFPLLV